jgi:uncharacterized protein (DUF433 family)
VGTTRRVLFAEPVRAVIRRTGMREEELLARIAVDPRVMTGKPVIRGTRLTVEHILSLLASGATVEEILREYPGLTREDIRACLLFAAKALADISFVPLTERPA